MHSRLKHLPDFVWEYLFCLASKRNSHFSAVVNFEPEVVVFDIDCIAKPCENGGSEVALFGQAYLPI